MESPRIQLLGTARVFTRGRWLDLNLTKPIALMTYLCVKRDWVSRNTLTGLLWPHRPERNAKHSLRQAIHTLQQAAWLELKVRQQWLRCTLESDVSHFKLAMDKHDWGLASALYSAPLWGDGYTGIDTFDEWLAMERRELHSLWREATYRYAEALIQEERYSEASIHLHKLMDDVLHTFSEQALRLLMLCTSKSGQRHRGLREFNRFQAQLYDQLGCYPEQDTLELARLLREGV